MKIAHKINGKMKKNTHKVLKKAHHIVLNNVGKDIPKYKYENAKCEARKLYRSLKETDVEVYDRLKMYL